MPFPATYITALGVRRPLPEWVRLTRIPAGTIRSRLAAGWEADRAVSTPSDPRFRGMGRTPECAPRPCPRLKRHTSGQAHVVWKDQGKRHFRYFGRWGSAEAGKAYARFQLAWASHAVREITAVRPGVGGPSIVRLVSDWNDRCKVEYRKDGRPTGEHLIHRAACRFVVDLTKSVFPGLLAAEFGPVHLREAREQMIAAGLSRTTIRAYQSRVVQMFGWAVGEDLIPAEVYQRLQRVGHLRPHATEAKEKVAKVAAKWREVEKVIRHLHADPSRRAVIEAIVRTHWYIGGRPSELVAMRPEDLDRSEEVWTYSPASHKNQHREKPLTYWIGPKCQALLLPLLERCGPGELVFRYPPRVYAKKGGGGTADHHEPRATIPITEATATAPHPQRGKSRPISRREYGRRVKKACEAAGVKPWTPHQLRHARATEVRRIYESNAAAAAAIGDSEEVTRAIYTAGSGVPNEVARRIARETG